MTKKTIALIYGGDSSEYEVSIKSGKHISGHLDRERYHVYEVLMKGSDWKVLFSEEKSYLIDKADFSFVIPEESGIGGKRVKFDKALIMIHGTPGENGLLQAYFEMIGMDFTTCSATVSAISFDKYACKCYLRDTGVKLAKEKFIRRGDSYNAYDIVAGMGLPLFVKPNNGGSSFGVTKVKHLEDLNDAIESAFKEDESVLVEEYIQGREMTNGVYEYNGQLVRLPVTEIISNNEFFDYEAKYLGASKEICPAEIAGELSERIIDTSHKIYKYLGCKGIVRVDYIVRGDEIFFLEINTVPGMTEMSLVPQQVRAAGMTIREFLNQLLG
ncbi:MAG: D-alanine--D-alanine ligase A [Bacteroidetes bacterium GWE2_39_28]|nr:MAG: D-alanine--D-alanine ligase A [Bacteroidetes bacterium GWE2_39_28]OFY11870.1 MAG: D-alanine--D-alanine ligase A [Bacteroidetes bacterium GWF2_39_10]OFZ08646.1 MAG: D-alanine--D-alanine ligase A [Bacteroidetes bacterium RIFOXYB2_FULL_39_7]OFZ11357.1 MAG: D-alanine--D-alanine ligase A [Bacteroidetes bacterium RIFOXYC2_FULL_39_11]HCT95218.1 D-alanine--D-alanine ligase [Rikenellaceae bacterium]